MERGGCIKRLSQEDKTEEEEKERIAGHLDFGPLGRGAKSEYDGVRLFLLVSWLRPAWSCC